MSEIKTTFNDDAFSIITNSINSPDTEKVSIFDPFLQYHSAIRECSTKKDLATFKIESSFSELSDSSFHDSTILNDEHNFNESSDKWRNKNHIPSFGNVREGQQWAGARRRADFVRALGLIPRKAGSSSRKAQEKSIQRFCEFIDDCEKKVLLLSKIYPEPKEKFRKERQRKYAPHIEKLLLNKLQNASDGILKTTKNDLLRRIGAISWNYRKVPISFYRDKFSEIKLSDENLKENLDHFHHIVDQRLSEIVSSALEYLQKKSLIQYEFCYVVAYIDHNGKKQYATMHQPEKLGLKNDDIKQMILHAQDVAASQIQISEFNPDRQRYEITSLTSLADAIKHLKLTEFAKNYSDFIKTQYGWLYTFQELKIVSTENIEYTAQPDEEVRRLRMELNTSLTNAIAKSFQTKIENREQAYLQKYKQVYESFILCDSDLTESGFFDETISKASKIFVYPENLKDMISFFINYEISIEHKDIQELRKPTK